MGITQQSGEELGPELRLSLRTHPPPSRKILCSASEAGQVKPAACGRRPTETFQDHQPQDRPLDLKSPDFCLSGWSLCTQLQMEPGAFLPLAPWAQKWSGKC